MLGDFHKLQRLAWEAEAQRLWDLIPKEFGDRARSRVFGDIVKDPDCFVKWLLKLFAGYSQTEQFSDSKDGRPILKRCRWMRLDDAEFEFECLARAWEGEIDIKITKQYLVLDKKSKTGNWLTVKFSFAD